MPNFFIIYLTNTLARFVSTEGKVVKNVPEQLLPLFEGDICTVLSDLPNGRALAKCYLIDENDKYTLNQRIAAYYDYNINQRFFFYYMNRNQSLLDYDDGVNQTNLRNGDVLNCPVLVPEKEEQKRIADYLDFKCAKIDSIIEKEQAIIEKLKEYKLVIVSELITKGLNSNATMKDSGIEWIGMIPDNWEIKRLKYVTKIKYGTGHEKEWAEGSDDAEIILVNSKFISTEGKVVKNVAEQLLPLYQNDICTVLSDLPNGKALAKCFIIDKDNQYTLNQRIAAYYDYQLDREYFFWFMNRNRSLLDYDDGVNQTNLRNGDVRNCPVLIPPLEEQKQIGKKINEVIDAVDKKIIKAESIIEKLYEYKKSLIYEVVTGKKEV